MTDVERLAQKYINEKKELQKLVLQIIEKTDEDADLKNLLNFLDTHQYCDNKKDIVHFLHLILTISLNHHRQPNFFDKIGKILQISSKFYKPFFSNGELFLFFQQSKPILLSLIKAKIITIDDIIFQYILNFSEMNENGEHYYFYPELCEIIQSSGVNQYKIEMNEDIEKFEINRRTFENESTISSMIREDMIVDFIKYVNKNNISLQSHIKLSIFETNSMFIEKVPTLIEYAFFYGSIQIINYLESNKVELTPSLWLYAVHSENAEVIAFLEEKNVEIDSRTFSEAIKCHHNSIAHYIYDKLLDDSTNVTDLSLESILTIYCSDNYEFFPSKIDNYKHFFSVCESGYFELADFHLKTKMKEIEDTIKDKESYEIYEIMTDSLYEEEIDVTYYLFSKFGNIIDPYNECEGIEIIALPPNIESIDGYTFQYCQSLKYITIPPSVTSIGKYAFFYCTSLRRITIPSSVTSIEENTFDGCYALTEITIPSSVKSIEYKAFIRCSSLKQITFAIPSSVTSIGESAFYGCSSLKRITFPSSVKSIGNSALIDCTSLKQITFAIPSSVTSISSSVFVRCSSLTQITIPSSVTEIGISSFDGCSRLTQITIPSSVTSIGENALNECSSLNQITIPSSVKSIENCAFFRCSSLTEVTFTIPSSVTKIGNSVFNGCSSLNQITIPSSVKSIGKGAFGYCTSLKQITFTIPSSVTSIGDSVFAGCSSLTQITFPSSVKSIGNFVFYMCTSLEQITIPSSLNFDQKSAEIESEIKINKI